MAKPSKIANGKSTEVLRQRANDERRRISDYKVFVEQQIYRYYQKKLDAITQIAIKRLDKEVKKLATPPPIEWWLVIFYLLPGILGMSSGLLKTFFLTMNKSYKFGKLADFLSLSKDTLSTLEKHAKHYQKVEKIAIKKLLGQGGQPQMINVINLHFRDTTSSNSDLSRELARTCWVFISYYEDTYSSENEDSGDEEYLRRKTFFIICRLFAMGLLEYSYKLNTVALDKKSCRSVELKKANILKTYRSFLEWNSSKVDLRWSFELKAYLCLRLVIDDELLVKTNGPFPNKFKDSNAEAIFRKQIDRDWKRIEVKMDDMLRKRRREMTLKDAMRFVEATKYGKI